MTILSRESLTPFSSKLKNPLSTAFKEIENYLLSSKNNEEHEKNLLQFHKNDWPKLKKYLVLRALHFGNAHGPAIIGMARRAPDQELATAITEMYKLIDCCAYYTSHYWRAVYYWLRSGGRFCETWPNFDKEDADLTFSMLSRDEIEVIMEDSEDKFPNAFDDTEGVKTLFNKIQKKIKNLCKKRLHFLSKFDPAIYSLEDLQQEVNCTVLMSLRFCDYFSDRPEKLIRWAMKSADNAIHSIRDYAQTEKRAKIKQVITENGEETFVLRECPLSQPLSEGDDEGAVFTLADSIRILGEHAFKEHELLLDSTCFSQLMKKADPKIKHYLRILWGGEHDEQFWDWFYYQEPELAKRAAYIEENPEAIGPWVQRWLNLSNHQLLSFLREELPEALERVSPQTKNLLNRYAND
jgi:hypothetical protein